VGALIGGAYAGVRGYVADAPLIEDEVEAAATMAAVMRESQPTHCVLLDNGRVLVGRIEGDGGRRPLLRLRGPGGVEKVELDSRNVERTLDLGQPEIELAPRDVRFLMEFPDFDHYYLPPFVIAADAPTLLVYATYLSLRELVRDFHREFGDLVRDDARGRRSHVCILRSEFDYNHLILSRSNLGLTNTVGFYDQLTSCLFVYDRMRETDSECTELSRYVRVALERWANRRLAPAPPQLRMDFSAQRLTFLASDFFATVRHEGAHQLAYTLGVHSAQGFEHLWVVEGLSQYCETIPAGALSLPHLGRLHSAITTTGLIPWHELIDRDHPGSFDGYGDRESLAYSQSWILFLWLMQPQYRDAFLTFLTRVRSINPLDLGRRHTDMLEQSLGIPIAPLLDEIEQALSSPAHLRSLTLGPPPTAPPRADHTSPPHRPQSIHQTRL
jgi:hypothetical protein